MDATISQFIEKTVRDVNAGLPEKYEISEGIEFEISVVSRETAKGGLDLKVISGGLNLENEQIHKIKFEVFNSAQQELREEKERLNTTNTLSDMGKLFGDGIVALTKKVNNTSQKSDKLT